MSPFARRFRCHYFTLCPSPRSPLFVSASTSRSASSARYFAILTVAPKTQRTFFIPPALPLPNGRPTRNATARIIIYRARNLCIQILSFFRHFLFSFADSLAEYQHYVKLLCVLLFVKIEALLSTEIKTQWKTTILKGM